MIKYIKSVLWRVAKRLSYIEDARCLKVNKWSYRLCARFAFEDCTYFAEDILVLTSTISFNWERKITMELQGSWRTRRQYGECLC